MALAGAEDEGSSRRCRSQLTHTEQRHPLPAVLNAPHSESDVRPQCVTGEPVSARILTIRVIGRRQSRVVPKAVVLVARGTVDPCLLYTSDAADES